MIDIGDYEMNKFVFFGDSVTESDRNMMDDNDLGRGYVFNLSNLFSKALFFNRGISGQRVKDLIKRVEKDVISIQPDYCFIWIGVNDAWLPYLLNQVSSIDTFYNDYNDLVNLIKEKSKKTEIVLIKPFALTIGHVSVKIYEDVENFRNQTAEVATLHDLDCIDIKEAVEEKLRYMPANLLFHDGIHPTLEGYEVITKVIAKYIKEHVK